MDTTSSPTARQTTTFDAAAKRASSPVLQALSDGPKQALVENVTSTVGKQPSPAKQVGRGVSTGRQPEDKMQITAANRPIRVLFLKPISEENKACTSLGGQSAGMTFA